MGNEMGNSNVSGLQEQDKTEVEAPNKSSEASMESVKAENEPVSSPKGDDSQGKHTGLDSEDPYGIGDPHIEKQTLDGREPDRTVVQAPDGSSKAPSVSNDTNDEETHSVLSSEDECFHETVSASEKSPSGKSDSQIQKQTSTVREGEESRNSPLDTKSAPYDPETMASVDLKSDQQDSNNIHAEPDAGDGSELQGSNESVLGSSEPSDSEEKGPKLEDEILQTLEGNFVPITNLEVANNGDDTPKEEMESQEENVLDMSNTHENKDESTDGVAVGKKTTLLNDVEKEGDEEHKPAELDLFKKDSNDLQPEAIPLSKSLDSIQVQASESEVKCVVQTDDIKLIENGSEIEQNKYNHNPSPLSEESVEESNMDKMNSTCQSESVPIGTDHKEKSKGSEVVGSNNYGMERDSQIDDAKVAENGYQVDVHDSDMSSSCEKKGMDLDKETEMVVEISTSSTESTMDTNFEEEKLPTCFLSLSNSTEEKVVAEMMERADDPDTEGKHVEAREIVKPVLSQFHPNEPAEILVPTDPVSQDQSQDARQNLTLEGSEMVENRRSSTLESNQENSREVDVSETSKFDSGISNIETSMQLEIFDISMDQSQGQELACDLTDYTSVHDSNMDFRTPENSENFKNQENFSTKVDVRTQSSFDFDNPVAETEVPASQSVEQDSEHNPLLHQTVTAKVESSAFASCDSESKESVERFATESNPENLNIHAEVTEISSFSLLPLDARTEESDRTPLLYQEKTPRGDVFELKGSGSETLASKIDVSARKPVAETEFATLKASKEESGQEPIQYQEQSVEKQVLTLERTDSEKLKTPLLSYSKEETYFLESPQKHERPVAKKEVEDMCNSPTNKVMSTSSRGREKRKPKSSFFSNCMCCTAVIQ